MNVGTHDRYDDLLDRALDGSLENAESRELDEHLKTCPACAELYEIVQATQKAWKANPDADLPDSIRDTVGERIQTEIAATGENGTAPGSASHVSFPKLAAVAIPLAAAAAIAAVLLLPRENPSPLPTSKSKQVQSIAAIPKNTPTTTEEAAPDRVGVPVLIDGRATLLRGAEKAVPIARDTRLLNGDVISLDTGATLEVEVTTATRFVLGESSVLGYRADDQSITLELKRGMVTARVEKQRDSEEFAVTTPAGRVEVRGTVFQVEVGSTAEATVRVAEGKVLVRDLADERNVVAVEQGQSLAVDWSDPTVRPLNDGEQQRLLALFMKALPEASASSIPPARITPDPKRWEELFEQALRLRKQRRYGEALAVYQKIARGARTKRVRAEVWFTIGQLRYLSGDIAGAQHALSSHRKLFVGTPYQDMAEFYLSEARSKLENSRQ